MIMNEKQQYSKFLSNIYLWMFAGLLISGLTGYFTATSASMLKMVYSAYQIIIILELTEVIIFSLLRSKISATVAKIFFIIYAFTSGLTFSSIFIVYKLGSILMIFLSSAVMFGLMALYGYTTKQDMSSFGRILLFSLLAIIIVSVINMFIKSSSLTLIVSIVSIVLFLGLTAYDMQSFRRIYDYNKGDATSLATASIYGALNLYLDFINIFIELLNLFGKRRD